MPSIKRLSENLINQIAAGEVVERPASVVKELLENALDADARRITVEVKDGGDTFLRVTDDGIGMDKEDAILAFERHATSKISDAEDLFNIRSLGFRGEAIASIASVSILTLQTKKRGALEGTFVMCEGGKIKKAKPIGAPEGTQIEVKQLFYNTPARRKYLKNPTTEYGHILNTVTGIALAFPEAAFRLIHDGKIVFDLPPADDDLTRIRALLGRNIADELVPVFYGHSQIQLKGYVGKPGIARANRNSQYFFVNRREVKSHVLSYAVKQSFHSLLPKEKYPVFLLYFMLDSAIVDVNVHPRKQEVRFADEKAIFKVVLQACGHALEKHVLAPTLTEAAQGAEPHAGSQPFPDYYQLRPHQNLLKLEDKETAATPVPQPVLQLSENATVEEALEFTKQFAAKEPDFYEIAEVEQAGSAEQAGAPEQAGAATGTDAGGWAVKRKETEEIIPLAQLDYSYILCRQGPGLVIIDQHAAHERIRYTEILEQFEKREKAIQPLLIPEQVELSHKESAVLQDNREILDSMGFEIEHFGGNTFSIHAVPSFIAQENLQKTILGLIDDLSDQAVKGDFQKRKERALIYMACRSAVKFGDPLSAEEQTALLKKLQTLALPYTCPHGRPTMITMSSQELLKRFGR